MSETVKFHAKASKVTGGGDDVRVVLELKDSPLDIAAAVNLFGMLKCVLHVAAYPLKEEDPFAEFRATIPELQTGISFNNSGLTVIKLDVPASDRLEALRLIGYNDKFVRFEIEDDGERVKKPKKEPKLKEPKGPYSYMWEYLYPEGRHGGRGFITLPGVRESIEEMRITETEPVWEILHRVFNVGGGSLATISDEEVYRKFPPNEYPAVGLAIERAMNFQRDKERQNNVNNGSDSAG